MNLSKTVMMTATTVFCLISTGCALMPERLAAFSECQARKRQAEAELLAARREEMRAQIDQEKEEILAQCEQNRENMQAQFKQQLKSKLAIDLAQQVTTNGIKIDSQKMQPMLAQAKQADEQAMKQWEENEQVRRAEYLDQLRTYARNLSIYEANQEAAANNCCTPQVCGCNQPKPPCMPKMPAYQPAPLPAQQNIPLSNIPLVMELNLNMGTRNPRIESGRQQTLPAMPGKARCCDTCLNCKAGDCCTDTPRCEVPAQSTKTGMRAPTRMVREPYALGPARKTAVVEDSDDLDEPPATR